MKLLIPVAILTLALFVNIWTDRLQTEGQENLGDRIDLVNSRVDRECGR